MDKPSLLSVIQANIPETYSEYRIADLVEAEIDRQIQDKINGIILKKPINELGVIVEYLKRVNNDWGSAPQNAPDSVLPGISDEHIAASPVKNLGYSAVHTPKSAEESKVARLPAKLKKRK